MQSAKPSSSMDVGPVSRRTTKLTAGAILLALVSAGIGYFIATQVVQSSQQQASSTAQRADLTQRQATVAANGAQVMPFDLTKTTHVFTDASTGGIEKVVANDPNDSAQISLIRMHLQHEAANFSKGDFSDPAAIHGKDMPGLSALEAGVGRFTVTYKGLPDGAQLEYSSSDRELIDALHQWFAAQRTDHNAGEDMDTNTHPGL